MPDSETVKIHKLESTDAFIAFDLDDAPSVGITRLARKVLQDGAQLLARSTTYSFASFGIQMGGGSAGINAAGDDGTVVARSAYVVLMAADGLALQPIITGGYVDTFAPDEGGSGWHFAERRFRVDHLGDLSQHLTIDL